MKVEIDRQRIEIDSEGIKITCVGLSTRKIEEVRRLIAQQQSGEDTV